MTIRKRAGVLVFLALALASSSAARADIHLDASGYIRSYAVFADNGESVTAPGDHRLDRQRLSREMEWHFSGERTLDNGLTVGVKSELKMGNTGHARSVYSITGGAPRNPSNFDEAYLYFSGGFGRFQFGAKDGAAYLLGVQAPSADVYVDGMRVYMQAWNIDTWDDGRANNSYSNNATLRLNYDNSNFGNIERATYLTPKWSGFQAGVSYAPKNRQAAVDQSMYGMQRDDRPGKFEDAYDAAARWDTKLGDVKMALGAGVSGAGTEIDAAPGASGSGDYRTYTAGLNLGWKEWSVGGALKKTNTGVSGPDSDQKVALAGIAWDQKPWHLGATYYHMTLESNAFSIGLADDIDVTRLTTGGWYQLTDGVTLRGTVSTLDIDNGSNSAIDPNALQVALGTEITF